MNRQDFYSKIILVLSWVCMYFAPTGSFILMIGFFVVADTITGVIAANARNEKIRSRKIMRTIGKFIIYSVAILVAFVVNKIFFPDFPALQLMGGFISFIEIKSIDENIKDVTGYSLFSAILDKMKPKDPPQS